MTTGVSLPNLSAEVPVTASSSVNYGGPRDFQLHLMSEEKMILRELDTLNKQRVERTLTCTKVMRTFATAAGYECKLPEKRREEKRKKMEKQRTNGEQTATRRNAKTRATGTPEQKCPTYSRAESST